MGRLTGSIMAAFGIVALMSAAQADDAPLPNDSDFCKITINGRVQLIENTVPIITELQKAYNEWIIGSLLQEASSLPLDGDDENKALDQSEVHFLEEDGLCGPKTQAAIKEAIEKGWFVVEPLQTETIFYSSPYEPR